MKRLLVCKLQAPLVLRIRGNGRTKLTVNKNEKVWLVIHIRGVEIGGRSAKRPTTPHVADLFH